MEQYTIPKWIIENKLNPDVAHFYIEKYGDLERYKQLFIEIIDNYVCIKAEYLDFVSRVSSNNVLITFVVSNDAPVANRRYQESYICQTPMLYAFEDLLRLYDINIPKVRQRNATRTFLEPLLPSVCAKFLILKALIESTIINGRKEIAMTISSKSLKVNYSFDGKKNTQEIYDVKKEYFNVAGINTNNLEYDFEKYIKQHRTQYRYSFFNGVMTLEILFNIRKNTFKKYAIQTDQGKLLTKAEYDIYNFIKDRNGATLRLIADEFNYSSTRAAKYHVDKLIKLRLVKRIGLDKSHNCFYRIL